MNSKISRIRDIQASGSDGKESVCNAGDLCLIPALGRSPGEGNGNPPQYPWDHKELDMTE